MLSSTFGFFWDFKKRLIESQFIAKELSNQFHTLKKKGKLRVSKKNERIKFWVESIQGNYGKYLYHCDQIKHGQVIEVCLTLGTCDQQQRQKKTQQGTWKQDVHFSGRFHKPNSLKKIIAIKVWIIPTLKGVQRKILLLRTDLVSAEAIIHCTINTGLHIFWHWGNLCTNGK